MIEKALKFIVGMDMPHYNTDDLGRLYTDKKMTRMVEDADVKTLNLSTLGSLVDYLATGYDEIPNMVYVHVESQDTVALYAPVNRLEDYLRRKFIKVQADIPQFPFGHFMPVEDFIIKVKSMFQDYLPEHPDVFGRDDMLRYAGNIQNGTTQTCSDDGVSQHAVIKTGIVSTEDVIAPSIVALKPYRTFLEVDQPVSEFLFRIKDDGRGGVSCAIFESDGSLWKMEAKRRVAEYIKQAFAQAVEDARDTDDTPLVPEVMVLY